MNPLTKLFFTYSTVPKRAPIEFHFTSIRNCSSQIIHILNVVHIYNSNNNIAIYAIWLRHMSYVYTVGLYKQFVHMKINYFFIFIPKVALLLQSSWSSWPSVDIIDFPFGKKLHHNRFWFLFNWEEMINQIFYIILLT